MGKIEQQAVVIINSEVFGKLDSQQSKYSKKQDSVTIISQEKDLKDHFSKKNFECYITPTKFENTNNQSWKFWPYIKGMPGSLFPHIFPIYLISTVK